MTEAFSTSGAVDLQRVANYPFGIAEALAGSAALVVDEYTDPPVADADAFKTSVASQATAITYEGTALNGVIGAAALTTPRNVTVTTAGATPSDAPATATFTGTDVNGAAIAEDISVPQTATTAVGNKAFKQITSIALTAGDGTGATMTFGFGAKMGLSHAIKSRAGRLAVIQEVAAGAVVTTGTFADSTTGAPNGTYTPSAAQDGANDYAVTYERQ